jgi:hypothetical protein
MSEVMNVAPRAKPQAGPVAKLDALYAYGSDEAYAAADKLTYEMMAETANYLNVQEPKTPEQARLKAELAEGAVVIAREWLGRVKKQYGEEEGEDWKRLWAEEWTEAAKAKAQPQPEPEVKPQPEPEEARPQPSAKAALLRGVRSWDEVVVPAGTGELGALTYVPGLVGDIVEWIVKGAPRANRMMALGVAVTIVGTLIGRWIEGPGNCATHLYIIILGPSGFGKDWPLHCGEQLMIAVGAGELVGPGEFASSPGFLRHLSTNPLIICFIDELGDELSLINNQGGNDFVTKIVGTLKKCWNAWATVRTGVKVHADGLVITWPAPSLIGAATPERFFETLNPRDLESGFANRMTILPFEGAERPPEQEIPFGADVPPEELVEALKRLPRQSSLGVPILDKPLSGKPPLPKREPMPWGPDAREVYLAFSKKMDQIGTTNKNHYSLSVRTGETAKRFATNVARGRGSPTVDRRDIEWGIALAERSFEAGVGGYARYMRNYFEFPKFCEEFLQHLSTHGDEDWWVANRDLERAFRGNKRHGFELPNVIAQLLAEERIVFEERGGKRGPGVKGYRRVKE